MEEIVTPYFLIRKDIIDDELEKLKTALKYSWNNYIIAYSYKTNFFSWLINYFHDNACYAEVVSDDEYELAKSIDKNRIVYNGIAKTKESFFDAIKNSCIVNIDSEYEIDWLEELVSQSNSMIECKVGVRVNFDLENYCPGQTQCGEDGERFGFCYENGELKRILDRIESIGIRVSGLHLHKSSKTRMPDIYRAIAEIVVKIVSEFDLDLEYVDIGGGFFGGMKTKPQYAEYFSMVAEIMRQKLNPKKTVLIVEPGMSLIGPSVDYVSKVLDVKRTTRNTFVITDGSRIHVDPLMRKTSYIFDINRNDSERSVLERQTISGFTCMENDRIFVLENDSELLPGDMIVYHKVGAYTMSLSPAFIKGHPDVYVHNGDEMFKVRNSFGLENGSRRSV